MCRGRRRLAELEHREHGVRVRRREPHLSAALASLVRRAETCVFDTHTYRVLSYLHVRVKSPIPVRYTIRSNVLERWST